MCLRCVERLVTKLRRHRETVVHLRYLCRDIANAPSGKHVSLPQHAHLGVCTRKPSCRRPEVTFQIHYVSCTPRASNRAEKQVTARPGDVEIGHIHTRVRLNELSPFQPGIGNTSGSSRKLKNVDHIPLGEVLLRSCA